MTDETFARARRNPFARAVADAFPDIMNALTAEGSAALAAEAASEGGASPAGDDGDLQAKSGSGFASAGTPAEMLAALGYPSFADAAVGDVLTVISSPSPTVAEVISQRPYMLANGWTAAFNYQTAQGQSDVVQLLKPAGSANLFVAEVATVTGGSEPNWASAPDPGDSVADGGVTWYNVGPYSEFPPTPTAYALDTAYPAGSFVYPTSPNGFLYIAFPPVFTSNDSTEPEWPIVNSTYVGDGAGFWMCFGSGSKLLAWVAP